jgi:hypothetical protein
MPNLFLVLYSTIFLEPKSAPLQLKLHSSSNLHYQPKAQLHEKQ